MACDETYRGDGSSVLGGPEPFDLDTVLKDLFEPNSPGQVDDGESNTGLCITPPELLQPAADEVVTDDDNERKQFATLQSVQQQSERPTSDLGQPNGSNDNIQMYGSNLEAEIAYSFEQNVAMPELCKPTTTNAACIIKTTTRKADGDKKKKPKMYESPDKDDFKVQRSIKAKENRDKSKKEKEEREGKICTLEQKCLRLQGEVDACRQTIQGQNQEIVGLNETIATLRKEKFPGEVKLKAACRNETENYNAAKIIDTFREATISTQQNELEIIIRPRRAEKRRFTDGGGQTEGGDGGPSASEPSLTFRAKLLPNATDVDL